MKKIPTMPKTTGRGPFSLARYCMLREKVLFCPSTTYFSEKFFVKILRLRTELETFTSIFILRMTVRNSDTNFVHAFFLMKSRFLF